VVEVCDLSLQMDDLSGVEDDGSDYVENDDDADDADADDDDDDDYAGSDIDAKGD